MSKKILDSSLRCLDETNGSKKSEMEAFQSDLYTNMSIVKNIYQKTKDSRSLASNSLVNQSLSNIEDNNANDGERKNQLFPVRISRLNEITPNIQNVVCTVNLGVQLDLKRIGKLGLNHLPICMAKTQKSFSDNAKLLGRPTGFTVNVREFEYAAGAGFIIPILGKMMRMPGLPSVPSSEAMLIDSSGKISGLS